ncbi:hypothetical protein BDY17DRAFT_302164 [Neohortaea acidophila]|uniref:Uncharacterized protein n=1 Tax=Neohortaea acidophila TaxID=245834 RepID=A0A6A6PMH2_9PEZI|nr:uncharacterized protein BDY17DRAFT_302164 [Neohortaea acidophila]KAF2480653.1 hypothetical protein BDY17DRAFT_302164 [Neohortaea acidophila]
MTMKLNRAKSSTRLAKAPQTQTQDVTFRASIDDLRHPDGRESLRQHFTGAFPETRARRPSISPMYSFDADHKSNLTRSTSHAATSHTSLDVPTPSSDSLRSNEIQRLSTVRESRSPIDISQAIQLLEEIKKTATAAELVALHKALLPRRESALPSPRLPSPAQEYFSGTPPGGFTRMSSMLPPGIATRDASHDPLKTPEVAAAESQQRRLSKRQSKKESLRALDLATKQACTTLPRAATPSDFDARHMGAFGPGTLRITNGTASPDPSVVYHSTAEDFRTAPSTPNEGHAIQAASRPSVDHPSGDDATPSTPLPVQVMPNASQDDATTASLAQLAAHSLPKPRSRRASEAAKSGIPVPEERDDSSPRMYRPFRPERNPESSPSRPNTGRSRASTRSQLPVAVESSPSRSMNEKEVAPHSAGDDQNLNAPASNNIIQSDEQHDPTQQLQLPRFAQRWSHRISFLPPEDGLDTQLPSTPGENSTALVNLARRLSLVTDLSSRDKNPAVETPVSAKEMPNAPASKQNGNLDHVAASSDLNSPGVNVAADPMSPVVRRESYPEKPDSGYGSDASNHAIDRKEPKEAGMVYRPLNAPAHQAYAGLSPNADEVSLYSFNAILNSPSLLSGLGTASPPQNRGSKKHLSLLGISKNKTPDLPAVHQDDTMQNSDIKQTPNRWSKSQKKLQKAMPASVRAELKAHKVKLEAAKHSKDVAVIPDIPVDVVTAFHRRSDSDPSRDVTIAQSTPTEPLELLASLPAEPTATLPVLTAIQPSMTGNRSINTERSGSTTPRANAYQRSSYQPSNLNSEPVDNRPSVDTVRHRPSGINAIDPALLARFRSRGNTMERKEESIAVPEPAILKPRHLSKVDTRQSLQRSNDVGAERDLRGLPGYETQSIADAVKKAMEVQKGYETESIAETVKKAMGARASRDSPQTESLQTAPLRKSKSKKRSRLPQTYEKEDSSHHADESSNGTAQIAKPAPLTEPPEVSWEEHAKAWRARRQSAGEALGRPVLDLQDDTNGKPGRKSTSSVHTIVRKPVRSSIVTKADEIKTHHRSGSAEVHAEFYRDLIGGDDAASVVDHGVGWRDSTGTFATVLGDRDAGMKSAQLDTAYLAKSYVAAAVRVVRTTSGRVVTADGNYHPYSPAEAERINLARAVSLAKLTGGASSQPMVSV